MAGYRVVKTPDLLRNYVSMRSESKGGLLKVLIKLAVNPIGNLWLNLEDVFLRKKVSL